MVHSLLYLWEQPNNSEVIENLLYLMNSLLQRRARSYILQGYSVQNTFLDNNLCFVKLPVLPALPPQSWKTRTGPSLFPWLATQVAEWLFVHHPLSSARLSLQTHHPTCTNTGTHCCSCTWICGSICECFLHFVLVFIFDLEAELPQSINMSDTMP